MNSAIVIVFIACSILAVICIPDSSDKKGPIKATPPPCKDVGKYATICPMFNKRYCEAEHKYYGFMKKNCKKTCGLCGSVDTSPIKATPPPCKDVGKYATICPMFNKLYCEAEHKYYGFMKKNCKKTCGLCGSVDTSPCKDDDKYASSCPSYNKLYCEEKHKYFGFMKKYCKKTCGFCGSVDSSPCKDDGKYATTCPLYNFMLYCEAEHKYYGFMKKNCKKTCGFCGSVDTSLEVRFTGKLTDLKQESVGNSVKLECPVDGEKPITVKWFKDGVAYNGNYIRRGGKPIFSENHQSISIKNIILDDGGLYMCIASNRYGTINHTIIVDAIEFTRSKPYITDPYPNAKKYTITAGGNITVKCEALSDASVDFQLLRSFTNVTNNTTQTNHEKIRIMTTYQILKDSDGGLQRNRALFHFTNVTKETYGKYNCMAGNYIGFGVRSFWLLPPRKTTITPKRPAPAECGKGPIKKGRGFVGDADKPWPWQAGMVVNGKFHCGGSLIDRQWIVTAAHCINTEDLSKIKVTLGDMDRSKDEGTEQTIGVVKIVSHKQYNPLTHGNDIALLKLEKKATLNDRVGLICLPEKGAPTHVNAKCYITGWGRTRMFGNHSIFLQEAPLPAVTNAQCVRVNRNGVTDHMVCAGYDFDRIESGCQGDSGDPFVCWKWKNRRWELHGAVSWGSSRCISTERYTVFTRVSMYRDWIKQQIDAC